MPALNVTFDQPQSPDLSGTGMVELTRELCQHRTAVVGDGNEGLFKRLKQELPFEVTGYTSGLSFNGWQVPQNWRVRRAKIFRGNDEVFDGTSNALGVGYYSKSFSGELSWEELKPHLVTNPQLPDAYMFHCMWQYRPWDADWCFSVPHEVYKRLGAGCYRVELETEYVPGEMLVAHAHKPGRSEKTIIFNAHSCHPHMANDGLGGAAALIRLMQWLWQQDTHYSYRLFIGPEHLGTVFYLESLPPEEINRMICGVFEEMPGTQGAVKATSTFLGGHKLDAAFANVLRHYSKEYVIVPWRCGAGNDETVWESPGYEVPFVELTRCEDQFAPFREYHSSLDTADILQPAQMEEMLLVMMRVVDVLEHDAVAHRKFDGLICLSNPEYQLYMERPDPSVLKNLEADAEKWGHLLDCLFRYFDGRMTILEIAQRHDLPFDRLYAYLRRFEDKGLISLEHAEIPRQVPVRA